MNSAISIGEPWMWAVFIGSSVIASLIAIAENHPVVKN